MIDKPLIVRGMKNMEIGQRVFIASQVWLEASPLTLEGKQHGCQLKIGDGCRIGHFNHIYATHSVVIEQDVLTADNVYISDNLHDYRDISIPIWQQPVIQNRSVVIGAGSWLGEHSCILGAHIGKHCVIGANAVVTRDIPDYNSVVVGIPARIIKRYNPETKLWERTTPNGEFLRK